MAEESRSEESNGNGEESEVRQDESEAGGGESEDGRRTGGDHAAATAVLLAVFVAVVVGIGNCLFFSDDDLVPREVAEDDDVQDISAIEQIEAVDFIEEAEEVVRVEPAQKEEAPPESTRLDDDPFGDFEEAYREHFESESRQFVHVTIDRPMYRPGQPIRWQSWHLSPGGFRLAAHGEEVEVELVDPGDSVVEELTVEIDRGMATGVFEIDEDQPGGQWKLRVTDGDDEVFERPVLISQFEPPRFLKEVDFEQQAYRQGEEVVAEVEIRRDTGDPMAGADLEGYVQIGGSHVADVSERLDTAGRTTVEFDLPDSIATDDASLVLSIEEGGMVETGVWPIPLALDEIEVAFKPEGGDLVEGLPGRVYFEATDLSGDPVEITGRILDKDGYIVTDVETEHRGRGRFDLTPEEGNSYRLQVLDPKMDEMLDLPKIKAEGCVLRMYDDFDSVADSVRVGAWCTTNRTVGILGAMGDELFDVAYMVAGPDEPAVAYLRPDDDEWPRPAGTVRVTVATDRPVLDGIVERANPGEISILADRVGFRGRRAQMEIDLELDREVYHPGETVSVAVSVAGLEEEPLMADLVLAAVDDRVHAEAAHLDAPSLLARLLLMADDIHFWGDVDEADEFFDLYADTAFGLELLMGVRGWRSSDQREKYYVDGGEAEIPKPPPPPAMIGGRVGPRPQPMREADSAVGLDMAMPEAMEFGGGAGSGRVESLGATGGAGPAGGARSAAPRQERSMPAAPAEPAPVAAPVEEPDVGTDDSEDAGPIAPRYMRDDDAVAFAAWDTSLRTGSDGRLTYQFELPEAIGAYRIVVEGVSESGMLGHGEVVAPVEVPLSAAIRLPEILSGGDRVDLPVTLRNATEAELEATVELDVQGPAALATGNNALDVTIPAKSTMTRYVPIDIEDSRENVTIEAFVQGGGFTDGASRTVSIEPRGFKRDWTTSGELPGTVRHEVPLMGMTEAGADGRIVVYTSPVAEALQGVDSMAQRPMGCFEQTSSRNHPNLMVWEYLKQAGELDSETESMLRDHTQVAYGRMRGFEISGGGFEWFGRGSAQAYLTAWALVQFTVMEDMLDDFDRGLVNRSVAFLRTLADDDGGWSGGSSANWQRMTGERRKAAELFVVYGLARSGHTAGFESQFEAIEEVVTDSDSAYEVALATAALNAANRSPDVVREGVRRLESFQSSDGGFRPTTGRSWAGGYGGAFNVETTGLAAMTLIEAGGSRSAVTRAIEWLDGQKTGAGWWGSTQSTVMALEARVAYEREGVGVAEGPVTVSVGGEEVASLHVTTEDQRPQYITDIAGALSEDNREIVIRSEVPLNYDVELEWRLEKFEAEGQSPLHFDVTVQDIDTVNMGDEISIHVQLQNLEDEGLGMSVARITTPAGVEVSDRELAALVERTEVDYYETTGREIILYFDELEAEASHRFRFSATADVPGRYEVPASVAYAYYRDESEWQWSETGEVKVRIPR